jgi:RNA polymerase sigma factor (sigma-70 family)
MIKTDHELLRQFSAEHSQDAFTTLVNRYINLVYSAALRQVRSPDLAQEVSQTVFSKLSQHAAELKKDTVLTPWLYQVTRRAAIDVVRREARRQAREQMAIQMSDVNDSPGAWAEIEPLLDEAMDSLDHVDRAAILLRYFESRSLREVGEILGASEDAAQKRVSRAIERLRAFLGKRGVSVGAGGLVTLLSTHAIQGAPAGLVGTVAAGALLTSSALSVPTALSITKAIAMTTTQKIVIAALAAGALAVGVYQTRQISHLRARVDNSSGDSAQVAALSNQVHELQAERDRATGSLAALSAENETLKKKPADVLKLRGEVGRLRQENAQMGSSSPLSKVTASPESRKLLRDQQKLGMGAIYKGFSQLVKATPEQTDKFNDLLADHIMQNVDNVTTALRDKLSPEEMNRLFVAQDADLQQKVEELLGPEAASQYHDYTKHLLSSLTAEQFKGMLTGADDAKADKSKQFANALQEATQAALAKAGLPEDYQAVPILNFRNIASESEGERGITLLEEIYQQAASSSSSFLTPEDLGKFKEFTALAVKNSRAALALNRTMMAPISN